MPRKISPHAELPRFQIYWQKRGDRHPIQPLVELYDQRDVRSVMAMLKQHEKKYGKRCVENIHGGFNAYTGTIEEPNLRAVYWSEEIMTDAEINSDNSPIREDVAIDIGIAMSWASVTYRAKREAASAGINFEAGDAE